MTDTPIVTSFTTLAPIIIQKYESYLPTAFNESLTLLQKVNMIIQSLSTTNDTVNSVIEQWNDQIVPYVNGDAFKTDISNKLDQMASDGTLDALINTNLLGSLPALVTSDKSNIVNAINEVKNNIKAFITINVKDYGAKGDGVTDDTLAIQSAINSAPNNSILLFPIGIYSVTNSLNITRPLIVKGEFATIKAGVNGLNNAFWVENASYVTFMGLSFDMSLKGRTSIGFKTSSNLKVLGCDFTGYSAQYGWATYDGGVCFTACNDVLVENNFFHQHGNQYDATTATLNRCITIQADSSGTVGDRAKVIGNTFYQVNQAIAIDIGETNIISNNIFYEVHDNSIYSLSPIKGVVITGNSFNDKYDECIILSGGNVEISNNIFRNSPNKFIGITGGGLTSLVLNGNTFDNTGTTTGSFIATRDPSYSIAYCKISNNTFLHPNADGSFYPFYFGNVSHLDMIGNTIKGSFPTANKIIDFVGTSVVGVIRDNYIEGDSSGSAYAVKVESGVTTCDLVIKDNDFVNCYAILDNLGIVAQGHKIQASSGVTPHILGKNKRREVFYSIAPASGKWTQDDIVWNTSPSASGNLGWVCTVSGDFAGTAPVFKTFGTIGA